MALYLVVDAFKKLGSPTVRNDDFYDRLSRKYSLILLGVSFLVVSTSQFVGHPINCYTQNIAGSHISYVNWVCWISNSYYLPFEKPLPNRDQLTPDKIPYYQWVPFIILCMMFLFYLPGFVWRNMNKTCGINTKIITNMVLSMDQLNSETREKSVRSLAKHIDKALAYHREYEYGFMYKIRRSITSILCCTLGRTSGNYLACVYIFVKFLYIANAIGQLFLLNLFMGKDFNMYGINVLNQWLHGNEMDAVERFPRITMCKFKIRTLGDNIQPYDVQCLLPINIYNEKIFLLIWFWLAFVAAASTYGLIKWLYYFTSKSRRDFIQRFLRANDIHYNDSLNQTLNSHPSPAKRLDDFINNYCRQDGILLLRIIKKNTNNVIAGEVICALWDNWKIYPQFRSNTTPESDSGIMTIGVHGSGEGGNDHPTMKQLLMSQT
ncbi:unnamed protein product [Didymodactylos carnosus]|uniref:Innexin n=1 Tax=Didymodactylos carnosus TaxID=1234261 RepID=A0A813YDT2_9BILA|nr:unnamed protein product [Didymodactylos carnosus]CAF0882671.1 unnamed protein product [Didymodactylos carnosus]CAF3647041.1 unnamed protein product [Didymodactylos carnosus]CAF3668557.1 unnamed protein product [Didymodactylos carnosus]